MYVVRLFALLVCLVLALGGCAGAIGGLLSKPAPPWFFVAFEVVSAIAGVMGVVAVRRAPRAGTALALLCVAGCAAAGGVLGYLGAGKMLLGYSLTPHLYTRLGIGGVLTIIAAVEVLRFNAKESVVLLIKGGALLLPVLVVLGAWWSGASQGWASALSGNVRTLGAIFGFLVVLALLCAGVHFTMRAFETALAKADVQLPTEPPAPAA